MKTTLAKTPRTRSLCLLLIFAAPLCLTPLVLRADPSPSASPPPSAPPQPVVTPYPLPEVASQAESAVNTLKSIASDLSSDQTTTNVSNQLPALIQEINTGMTENSRLLSSAPSLDTIRQLQNHWGDINDNLKVWVRDLARRATSLENIVKQLDDMDRAWVQTLKPLRASGAPDDLMERANRMIGDIVRTRAEVKESTALTLGLQARVADQSFRVTNALQDVKRASDSAVNHLFVRDSSPIWAVFNKDNQSLVQSSSSSLTSQVVEVKTFASRQGPRFLVHLAIIVVLAFGLYKSRTKLRQLAKDERSLEGAIPVFDHPLLTALASSVLLSELIYSQAPRMFGALLGALALFPATIILRRLLERRLVPTLNILVFFFLFDRLRTVAASLPLLDRFLFIFQMLVGVIFLVWLAKMAKNAALSSDNDSVRKWRGIYLWARIGVGVFAIALLANVFGYAGLGSFLGRAVLISAYVAVMLFAVERILEGLLQIAFKVKPLRLLRIVRRHRPLLQSRVFRLIQFLLFFYWLFLVANVLGVWNPIVAGFWAVADFKIQLGSLSLTVGSIFSAVVTMVATFRISKFLRFLLDEDIYQRFQLARGRTYAISTTLHYALLVIGFFITIGALGIDMTKFTIVAGAFSVGIGFGLQNIINNFVSGLILLFERPVKVGDVIQVAGATGIVNRIGIRASVVRTNEGSEIIVPNGTLISEAVTNWTFSDQRRVIEVPVDVIRSADPQKVIDLLKGVATEHALVSKEPVPEVLMTNFGAGNLSFELRAWTTHAEEWSKIRSDLSLAISHALEHEKFAVP